MFRNKTNYGHKSIEELYQKFSEYMDSENYEECRLIQTEVDLRFQYRFKEAKWKVSNLLKEPDEYKSILFKSFIDKLNKET